MKIALLKGNRFNPWHLEAFQHLKGQPQVVAFRADPRNCRFGEGQEGACNGLKSETLHLDTEQGPAIRRWWNRTASQHFGRPPRFFPFYERLQGFDLIQSWELYTDWSEQALHARLKWDIPLAVMVWDNIPFNMERNSARRQLKFRVATTADRFIVYTERSRRMLDVEGVEPRRVIRIDPGLDTLHFSPGRGHRESFGLFEDEFVLLFVGWLAPRKGIEFLLLALRELIHDEELRHFRPRLLVVGTGPGKDRIESLMHRLQIGAYCTFAGTLSHDQMPEAFRVADLFVFPSIATPEWQEQFGMSLLEALSCGVPVVSTLSGASAEIVEDAGVLCQPNDFVSLYTQVRALMLDAPRREALGRAGRALAERKYTLQRYADALSTVYQDMMRGA